MFGFDTLVDHNVNTVKQAFVHIPNPALRNNLESLVDAQAVYTKSVFAAATEIGKTMYDSVLAYTPKAASVTKK